MADLEEGEILDSDSDEITEKDVKVPDVQIKIESADEMKVEPINPFGKTNFSENPAAVVKTEIKPEVPSFSFHESNLLNLRDNLSSQGKSSQFSIRRSPGKAHQKESGKPLFKHSDDDESATSDEDTDLWKCKKARYFSSSKEKSMQLSNEITSPKRNGHHHGAQNSENAVTNRRKLNNIWGSVIEEQAVTQIFSDVGVDKNPEVEKSDRNVERYDFTKAYDDDDRHNQDDETQAKGETHDPFNKVIESHDITTLEKDNINPLKRKRKSALDRVQDISEWSYDKKKTRDHFGVDFEDSDAKIVNAISIALDEPKIDLMANVVKVLGSRKALETAYLTEDVEEAGGMMTFDGHRRRTPGGVFIQLLKKDKEVSKEQYKEIFGEEERLFKKACRQEQKQRKKEAKQFYNSLPQSRYLQWDKKRNQNVKNPQSRYFQDTNSNHQNVEKMDDDVTENRKSKKKNKKKQKKRDKNDTEMKDYNNSSDEVDHENGMDNETGEISITTNQDNSLEGDINLDEDVEDIIIG